MKTITILVALFLLPGCTSADVKDWMDLESWSQAIKEYQGSAAAYCAHEKQMSPNPEDFSFITCRSRFPNENN